MWLTFLTFRPFDKLLRPLGMSAWVLLSGLQLAQAGISWKNDGSMSAPLSWSAGGMRSSWSLSLSSRLERGALKYGPPRRLSGLSEPQAMAMIRSHNRLWRALGIAIPILLGALVAVCVAVALGDLVVALREPLQADTRIGGF